MSSLASLVTQLLGIVAAGIVARLLASRFKTLSYSIVLVALGLALSVVPVSTSIRLSHDLIFLVILPPILFAGGLRLDYQATRNNAPYLAALLLLGLPLAILGMGFLGQYLFPYPLVVTLLLASMLYPLDPVAVLSVFKSLDAPDRLLTIIEGEPLFDDGLAVVFFGTFLGLFRTTVEQQTTLGRLLTIQRVTSIGIDFVVVTVGGILVGVVFGGVLFTISRYLGRDNILDLLLSLFIAYGSVLIAEHYLRVSGILAVVSASIVAGYAIEQNLVTSDEREFIQSSWEEAELLANTAVYLLIGVYTDPTEFASLIDLILAGTILFLGARTVVVVGVTYVTNRWLELSIPWSYQPVLIWGALHTVVPIAVALSLPATLPYTEELRTIVFGVAVMSILFQGLTIPYVLRWLDFGESPS